MSAVFRTVGQVARIATPFALLLFGPKGAAIAAATAMVADTAASITARPPPAIGQVQSFLSGANQPLPYLIGEAYTEGVELYKTGYGGERNDVQNPFAFLPRVLSSCGPIESIGPSYVNWSLTSFSGSVGSVREAVGFYENYLWIDEQLGQRPESRALGAPSGWGTPARWSADHKLSGFAAVAWSLQWSKKGKRFQGGQIPPLGKVPQGVKVYDPRADSTFPGGSGPQRIDDESTWAYSRNPALHAITYAYGRRMNGKPIFGVRLFDPTAINLAQAAAWANVCDANGWTVNGTIYEPADKWSNLKRICEAGGGQPIPGAVLSFDWQAPRISLYTVGKDDLAGPVSAALGKGWKARHNVLKGRFRSPAHQWGYVQGAEARNADWIAADGEEKVDERQFDLVTDKDQCAELITYDLWQRREAGPFRIVCKPHMRAFRPGMCITLGAELGAHPAGAIKVVIRRRAFDVVEGTVTFVCEGETDAKHTAALGLTGTAPPTVEWPTQEEIEQAFAINNEAPGETVALITGRAMVDADPPDGLIQATDSAITVETHTARYADRSVSVTGATITTEDDDTTAIAPETRYFIYYDNFSRSGGAVTFKATRIPADAYNSPDNPGRHYVGSIVTDVVGGSGVEGGGSTPPGFGDEWNTIPPSP